MILEVHGDACRLGYLKLASCILEDGSPRSPDYLASLMLEACRSLADDVEEKQLGLLKSEVNARNYVKLAENLGFYDRKTGRAGDFGAVYLCLSSSEPLKKHVAGEEQLPLSKILLLNQAEKLLFIQALLTKDHYMMAPILKWVFKAREFTRQQAMQTIMEEIYPEALRRYAKKLPEKLSRTVEKELAEASAFREKRESYVSKIEWIRSRQYAKYRHAVPPRLEWLVDVGLLERAQRGRYVLSTHASKHHHELEVVLSKPREKIEQEIFKHLAPAAKHPPQNVESQAMADVYQSLNRMMGRVRLDLLCLASAYTLVEKGFKSSPHDMMRVFSYLSLLYPERVFATYSDDGAAEVSGLDIQLTE
ncbi:MAG: hypothetical protein NZ941_04610 [Candidatus Caldarchaeum sp.]|nr:hypothetical protein [Candidatus Caldarchaeum sp.]MDW7978540.1 hypothetical protein [Candidatus Caldarchaeum sp.]